MVRVALHPLQHHHACTHHHDLQQPTPHLTQHDPTRSAPSASPQVSPIRHAIRLLPAERDRPHLAHLNRPRLYAHTNTHTITHTPTPGEHPARQIRCGQSGGVATSGMSVQSDCRFLLTSSTSLPAHSLCLSLVPAKGAPQHATGPTTSITPRRRAAYCLARVHVSVFGCNLGVDSLQLVAFAGLADAVSCGGTCWFYTGA